MSSFDRTKDIVSAPYRFALRSSRRFWDEVGYGKLGWTLFTPYKTTEYVSKKLEGRIKNEMVDYFVRSLVSVAAGGTVGGARFVALMTGIIAADMLSGHSLAHAPEYLQIGILLLPFEEFLQPIAASDKLPLSRPFRPRNYSPKF
jgi:hypothetical protein